MCMYMFKINVFIILYSCIIHVSVSLVMCYQLQIKTNFICFHYYYLENIRHVCNAAWCVTE